VIGNGSGAAATPGRSTVPAVSENPTVPAPAGTNGTGSNLYDQYYRSLPEGSGISRSKSMDTTPPPPPAPRPPIVPRYTSIALDTPAADATITGQVVSGTGNDPLANTKVVFISESATGGQESTTTDGNGKFNAKLASGSWLVYVRDENGIARFQKKIDVREREVQMRLVSR
jgi:hypothetical protein